jgi:hypothetical protein
VDETQLTNAIYVVEGETIYVEAVIEGYTVLQDADGNRIVKIGDNWYAVSYDPAFTAGDMPTDNSNRLENSSEVIPRRRSGHHL